MWLGFALFPESASTMSGRIDLLYFFLVAVSLFFAVLISLLVIYFAIKYRQRPEVEQPPNPILGDIRLELLWTFIPLALSLIMFVWGTNLFFAFAKAPSNALEIFVVGKQWMWKLQHLEGKREINELHVPVGYPIKLTMTSEDVIHSFFIPAFRVKMDVLPGRYTSAWFEATKTGEYHLFCAEYCGTKHSGMIGKVVVMEPWEYEKWLQTFISAEAGESLEETGEKIFNQLGCQTCHKMDATARGPSLAGLFGSTVQLKNGKSITADEGYIRESVLNPNAKMVAGYEAIMPTYTGQINEEQLIQILAYIKSLENIKKSETNHGTP
jgi:cytochrome c oxidase subunit 2